MEKVRFRIIITCVGSFLAFYMGAAFASGQEILQSFTAFGVSGYVGLAGVILLYAVTFYLIQVTAQREKIEDPFFVFKYFCGEKLGQVFIWISTVLLAGNLVMMTASAGANLHENLGVPEWVGRCVVILAILSVCMGLDGIVSIISKIGPVVGITVLIVAIVALIKSDSTIAAGLAVVDSLEVYKGGPNAGMAAAKYGFYCIFVAFSASVVCGNLCNSKKEAGVAALSQVLALGIACIVMFSAQISNIASIYQYEIPNLKLVALYIPSVATLFSALLLACTYASSTIQLWTCVRKFAVEGTTRYKAVTIAIGIAVLIISSLLPFSVILNKLFMCGYVVGPIFFVCIIGKSLIQWISERQHA